MLRAFSWLIYQLTRIKSRLGVAMASNKTIKPNIFVLFREKTRKSQVDMTVDKAGKWETGLEVKRTTRSFFQWCKTIWVLMNFSKKATNSPQLWISNPEFQMLSLPTNIASNTTDIQTFPPGSCLSGCILMESYSPEATCSALMLCWHS